MRFLLNSIGCDPSKRGDGDGENTSSYSKVLTQSDANTGGGFSVPKMCADSIFPPLNFEADPPVQTITLRDVHGSVWDFRHIYRGTPRRHLLTTGWSPFVNSKKLVVGDSIVFVRVDSGHMFIGVRRFFLGGSGGEGSEVPRWNTPFKELRKPIDGAEETPVTTSPANVGFSRRKGRISAALVAEAAGKWMSGRAFEAVYYPRAGMPEFCVEAEAVEKAMNVHWTSGIKFRMKIERDDSSTTTWCSGAVSAVSIVDPVAWPNSPWKMLQVTWDEPETLTNIKRVSPWEIEVVYSMSPLSIPTFSFQKKKSRTLGNPEPLVAEKPVAGLVLRNLIPSVTNYGSLPAGMQGARHESMFASGFPSLLPIQNHHGSLSDSQFLQNTLPPWNYGPPEPTALKISNSEQSSRDTSSGMQSLLNGPIENREGDKPESTKSVVLQLFGRTILTEPNACFFNNEPAQEKHHSLNISPTKQLIGRRFKERDQECVEGELNEKYTMNDRSFMTNNDSMICKVYKEAEGGSPGHAIDLSKFCSYEQLFQRLSKIFSMEESQLWKRVFYKGNTGSLRRAGEEPFREFARKVRKLMII